MPPDQGRTVLIVGAVFFFVFLILVLILILLPSKFFEILSFLFCEAG